MLCANFLWYLLIHTIKLKKGRAASRLESYLQGTAVWMLFAFLALEVLSLFQGINRVSLTTFWILLDVVLLASWQWNRRKVSVGVQWEEVFPIRRFFSARENWIFLAIAVVTFLLALWTVPYNWDSMTYRLSRIAHWVQNGSVAHYTTNSIRQIANPPLGEFVQLHIYVLSGGSDLFLNLMQYASYLTCAGIVYGIAGRLKCERCYRFLATLLFMSMPIAFAEALNTQVDLLSAVWLLIHCIVRKDRLSVLFTLASGALGGNNEAYIFDY